jgi:pimeloyl-ACP methyl ester carboxylesterase
MDGKGRSWRSPTRQPENPPSLFFSQRAKFEVIKGDGSSHVVPIERPDDFNSLVTKFLS